MAEIEEIRSAVKVLSTLTNSEWEALKEVIANKPNSVEDTEEQEKNSWRKKEKKVTELLKMIGIPVHIKGYAYTKTAILWVLEKPDSAGFLATKELYPYVAKEYSTTASRVERAIRHAFELAWDRGDMELLDKIFMNTISATRGKPTNSEGIALLAEYINLYML